MGLSGIWQWVFITQASRVSSGSVRKLFLWTEIVHMSTISPLLGELQWPQLYMSLFYMSLIFHQASPNISSRSHRHRRKGRNTRGLFMKVVHLHSHHILEGKLILKGWGTYTPSFLWQELLSHMSHGKRHGWEAGNTGTIRATSIKATHGGEKKNSPEGIQTAKRRFRLILRSHL